MERIIIFVIFASLHLAMPAGLSAHVSQDSLFIGKELDEIVVTAQRKYAKPTTRGLRISMSGNPLSKIGSATEAILQMPMIDGSAGSISVIGKGQPVFYINGRKMMDRSELDMLASADLASVEIVTNPSAEYGSDVSAVILIRTKQPLSGLHVAGKVKVTASEEWSESGSANLQYHDEKGLTIFSDLSYDRDAFRQKRSYAELFKESPESSKVFSTTSHASAESHSQSLTADGGINYDFGKNSIGTKYIFRRTPGNRLTDRVTTRTDALAINDISSATTHDRQSSDHYINAFGDFRLPHETYMHADFDYMSGRRTTRWHTAEEESERVITNLNRSHHSYFGAKLRLSRKFGNTEMEAGVEYAHTRNNQDFTCESSSESFPEAATDVVRQNLQAFYLSFDHDINDRWNIYGGLRHETTHTHYEHNNVRDNNLSRRCHDFLPNLGIQYKAQANVTMYYRAKIIRPSYTLLENNYAYVTPTLWETGNPELLSSRTHNIGLSIYWRNTIFQGTYIRSERPIGDIYSYSPELKANVRSNVNLPDYDTWQFVISQGFNIGFWHPALQGVLSLQNLKYGSPLRKYDKPFYQISMNNRFDLPAGVQAYLSAFYLGTGNSSTTYSRGTWQMALTLSKNYRNWAFTLSANDIFGTWKQRFDVISNTVGYKSDIKGASRYIALTIRYKVNTAKGKYKGKAVREDEMDRL